MGGEGGWCQCSSAIPPCGDAKKPDSTTYHAGITFLAGAVGAAMSLILPLRFLMQEFAISLCTSAAFFASCTFFKVQDEY